MNPLWFSNLEIIAEERRADFQREVEQFRLEREADNTKDFNPNWAVRTLQGLSTWLITICERVQRKHQHSLRSENYQSLKVAK